MEVSDFKFLSSDQRVQPEVILDKDTTPRENPYYSPTPADGQYTHPAIHKFNPREASSDGNCLYSSVVLAVQLATQSTNQVASINPHEVVIVPGSETERAHAKDAQRHMIDRLNRVQWTTFVNHPLIERDLAERGARLRLWLQLTLGDPLTVAQAQSPAMDADVRDAAFTRIRRGVIEPRDEEAYAETTEIAMLARLLGLCIVVHNLEAQRENTRLRSAGGDPAIPEWTLYDGLDTWRTDTPSELDNYQKCRGRMVFLQSSAQPQLHFVALDSIDDEDTAY